jgi:ATP-dependent exoDNAse (exonuclease V) beta subunit
MELNKLQDKDLEFNEELHEYKYKGRTLKSVTTLLDEYKTFFDEEAMSLRVAEREGREQQQVLSEWKDKNDAGILLGNSVHKFAEAIFKGQKTEEPIDEVDKNIRKFFFKYLDEHKRLTPIASELRVILPCYGIAGTIDLIMKSEDNKLFLYDIKTSKEITSKSYNKKLKYPLDYIDDCNFNNYSLQLSMYKLLLKKKYNIDITGCYLIHLTSIGYKEFKCNDYTSECEVILLLELLRKG